MTKNIFFSTISLLFVLLLNSCNNDPKESFMLYKHDGELPHGWMNLHSLQKVDGARSGSYVSVIDGNSPYGIGFKDVISAFPLHFGSKLNHPFNIVEISCMVKSEAPQGKVSLIISLDSAGVQKHWQGVPFEKEVQNTGFQEIKTKFKLPGNTRPEDVMTTYVLYNTGEKVFVDDFSMKLYLE